jgi:DNA-binding MarR family transcriptional regulator
VQQTHPDEDEGEPRPDDQDPVNEDPTDQDHVDQDHVDRVLAQWAEEDPELDLSSTVAVIARLGRVRAYVDRELDELFGRHGLTRQSWDVLACLRRAGKPYRLTPTEINQEVMRTSGAITHTLHALEYAGLIARVPNPEDGRSSHVQLSAAGRRLLRRVGPEHVANEQRMLTPLAPEELTSLASLLRKLLVAFERENPAPHATATQRRRATRPAAD